MASAPRSSPAASDVAMKKPPWERAPVAFFCAGILTHRDGLHGRTLVRVLLHENRQRVVWIIAKRAAAPVTEAFVEQQGFRHRRAGLQHKSLATLFHGLRFQGFNQPARQALAACLRADVHTFDFTIFRFDDDGATAQRRAGGIAHYGKQHAGMEQRGQVQRVDIFWGIKRIQVSIELTDQRVDVGLIRGFECNLHGRFRALWEKASLSSWPASLAASAHMVAIPSSWEYMPRQEKTAKQGHSRVASEQLLLGGDVKKPPRGGFRMLLYILV